ncbi:N-acetyltransferase [Saccharospirillum salsuginis]|uniref:N-acetyltransferase n=1 Tax=Saccharospirillum salsuginis TaxID=418750 RepID=A0A918K1D7_9GAMM|nr:N-acetyltransferase [Saccharospirillum salsuginis]
MNIRLANDRDLNELERLNTQIAWYHHDKAPQVFVPPGQKDREYLVKNLKDPDIHIWVAEQDDRLIGFVTANIHRNTDIPFLTTVPICWVKTIVVDEANRSTGVGKALLDAVASWARQNGAREIKLQVMEFNDSAQAFYAKLGYTTQSRTMSLELDD